MADYADAVQGVQQQAAAFELLARVHIKEALSTLNDDEQGILLGLLRNTLEPRLAMYTRGARSAERAVSRSVRTAACRRLEMCCNIYKRCSD